MALMLGLVSRCIVSGFMGLLLVCAATGKVFAQNKSQHSVAAPCFDNKALEALGKRSLVAPQLIYIWSPRMVLSAQHAAFAAQAAKELGMGFVALSSPNLAQNEVVAALNTLLGVASRPVPSVQANQYRESAQVLANSQVFCATRLEDIDALLHYPSSYVLQNGRLNPRPIRGAMPLNYWRQALRSRLADTPSVVTSQAMLAASNAENFSDAALCVAQNEFIPLPAELAGTSIDGYGKEQVAIGSYERISPDGRFILRSYSGAKIGQVSLVELSSPPTKVEKVIATPLSNEAFPVQGTWRYLVDVNGEHYDFVDILVLGQIAKPRFKGGMSGFYAAAAELPADLAANERNPIQSRLQSPIRIRSFSWPNSTGPDVDTQGEGNLMARTIEVDTQLHKIVADSGGYQVCAERSAVDGRMYSLPMISTDGQEFATLPERGPGGVQRMKIFSFGQSGKDCVLQGEFAFSSGKTIFGFAPYAGQGADLAYEYKRQIWWYSRAAGQPFNIAPFSDKNAAVQEVMASAFPGITRDGRIIYAATWKDCGRALGADESKALSQRVCQPVAGYIISDPLQSNAYRAYLASLAKRGESSKLLEKKACTTQQDVVQGRANFAQERGISTSPHP